MESDAVPYAFEKCGVALCHHLPAALTSREYQGVSLTMTMPSCPDTPQRFSQRSLVVFGVVERCIEDNGIELLIRKGRRAHLSLKAGEKVRQYALDNDRRLPDHRDHWSADRLQLVGTPPEQADSSSSRYLRQGPESSTDRYFRLSMWLNKIVVSCAPGSAIVAVSS